MVSLTCNLTGLGRRGSCIKQDHSLAAFWELPYGEAHMARDRCLWPRAQPLPNSTYLCPFSQWTQAIRSEFKTEDL